MPRQKLGYHLKMLEEHGLVELVETRRRENLTERLVRATATALVISPEALPELAPDPGRLRDQASAWWMLALAARLVRELGRLIAGATASKQQLPVFAIDAEIIFADARARTAFSAELGTTMAGLVEKYHDGTAPKGRNHRVLVALHPKPKEKQS
ncbi:helix-turn-helix transcriptional regulator [Paeniglutamicibacter cryotolerans]|uniref:DNA-binding transcriptional ArsR family regulator n=1 Tax=Paeniglutamicibacter cryotolerans TaxID=670079 RepID=A0A839QH95_9MICC|nr:helix-turn-helix transcriptional regulator [Paeniglutamicibacter cryotolerans]MBB2994114.1 DNA-binding transcriptional ArsR family regulator [Paeniglutamicibacter cryotolerans]